MRRTTIASACDASLQRLGIETIDLYYHHKDDPDVPLADSLGAMDALVKAGKIRAIGLSQYSAERLEEAMRHAEANGSDAALRAADLVQSGRARKLEGPLRDAALTHGLGIIPFYGLANGFLTGKYRSRDGPDEVSTRATASRAISKDGDCGCSRRWIRINAETGAPLAAIALAWTNAQPGIASTLASATSVEQLSELTAALHLRLTPEQIRLLDDASAEAVAA